MLYARKAIFLFVSALLLLLENIGSKAEGIFQLVIQNGNQILLVFIAL